MHERLHNHKLRNKAEKILPSVTAFLFSFTCFSDPPSWLQQEDDREEEEESFLLSCLWGRKLKPKYSKITFTQLDK